MAQQFDDKRKLLIAAAMSVLIVGVLAYLIYSDYETISSLKAECERHLRNIDTAKAKIREIPALREQRYKLTQIVEEYVRILPDQREVEALYDTLAAFEEKSHVRIRSITAPPPERGRRKQATSANFVKHTRDLNVYGTFFQVATFINLIENYKRFMRVDSFTMRPGGETEGCLNLTMKMSTFTYQRRARPASGKK